VALVFVLTLVAAGCGGKSDKEANEAYANSVCGAISGWEQEIRSIVTTFSGDASSASLEAKVTQAEEATKELVAEIKAVPPPDTSEGQAAKQQLDQLADDASATVSAAQSALAQLGDNASATAIAGVVAALVPQVQNLASSGKSALATLKDAGGELASAFKNADSCKDLGS
jgi:hypothetical protein